MDARTNKRRASLIYKKHLGEGLTDDEQKELTALQARSSEELSKRLAPRTAWLKKILEEEE